MRDLTSKRSVLLLALIAGVLALVASGRTWVTGSLNDGVLSNSHVTASGNQAVPGFFGIALVAVAGLLAAATAGRIVRWPAVALSVVSSIAMIVLLVRVLLDPADALRSRMTQVVGHTGEAVAHGTLGPWFWIAVFAALLSLMTSVLGIVGLRRWAGLSSRYDAPAPKERAVASDWDLMNEGIDPTEDVGDVHESSDAPHRGASRAPDDSI